MTLTSKRNRLFRFAPAIVIALFLTTAPLLMGTAIVSLMTKTLIFAVMAMGLDIAFGYTGLWSFGHAALFGVAAYTNGILIKHYDLTSFWIAAPAGILTTILASAVFGFIALRTSGIYFLLITFALGQLIFSLAHKWAGMTGGSDGLGGIPYPELGFSFSPVSFYYFVLIIFTISVLGLYCLIKSPFGISLQGIRQSESRMQALGYHIWLHKFLAFLISGLFAGVAGILYIHFNGIITPESVGMTASGLAIIMIIIGGCGTLWGAIIGSGFIFVFEYFISILTPERWPMILGACFVAVVMYASDGFFPWLSKLWNRSITS